MQIPFQDLLPAIQPIRTKIAAALDRVVVSGWYMRGVQTELFEQEWANYCGQSYCVACANGTDAITIAAKALELKNACIPAITTWYTAEGLNRAGCKVTSDEITSTGQLLNPDENSVAVPLYGTEPSIQEQQVCKLFDGAQAHGWKPPQHAVVAWSFYPTKNLGAMGDAGAATTNDKDLADQMRLLSGRDDIYRSQDQIVSRMDEMQAAVLRVKLTHLDSWLEARKEVARRYWSNGIQLVHRPEESNFHLLTILHKNRTAMAEYLKQHGVGTKVHYATPIHKYPGWAGKKLPVAEAWCDEILSLPCYPGLTNESIDYVCGCIHNFQEFI